MTTLRELCHLLGDQIHDRSRVKMVFRDMGMSLATLDLDGPPVDWWENALALAYAANRTEGLFGHLREALPAYVTQIRLPTEWERREQALVPIPPGSLYEPAWDVGRHEVTEQVLSRARGTKATIVVVTPDGHGRTWFLRRIRARLQATETPRQFLELTELVETPRQRDFFAAAVVSILRSAGRSPAEIAEAWNRKLPPAENLRHTLRVELNRTDQSTMLMVDVPNWIWSVPAAAPFFSLLRSLGNDTAPPWNRLQLLVGYSTTPSLWKRDLKASPLNVDPISLPDLSIADVLTLAQRHGLLWTGQDLDRVHELLGGHPRLVQQLLFHCYETRASVGAVLDRCHEYDGLFSTHLSTLKSHLQEHQLEETLRHVAETGKGPDKVDDFQALHAAGFLRWEATRKQHVLRYGLLRHLLRP
ncbi:MAG: AAA-like domain-containing protein [Polyangiales bacterium]